MTNSRSLYLWACKYYSSTPNDLNIVIKSNVLKRISMKILMGTKNKAISKCLYFGFVSDF